MWLIVYTWDVKRSPCHNIGVYVATIKLHGASGLQTFRFGVIASGGYHTIWVAAPHLQRSLSQAQNFNVPSTVPY